ncbi:4-hydroxy 2-oxovalerate aldolase [Ruminococcaceae bacterium KH2T8]|nr:4-hydroxy 2-oxovalerate aldolase [Ruminococcaceae bacterium KH2T8]
MQQLLDCTLRDGAYIVDAKFGTSAIRGIVSKLQNANIDIIECGWLKNSDHKIGTTFFHVPEDIKMYVDTKKESSILVAMIDWDRYDLDHLPDNDHSILDAIRVVFPRGKAKEGIEVGRKILEKGYKVYFQAANTLAYSDEELIELAKCVNGIDAEALSIVDTFGAMYEEDLDRIIETLDEYLDPNIKIGFHSHNNQQLSFALTQYFVNRLQYSVRDVIVDSSLCGMGRGAGNTTTELAVSFLNRKYDRDYEMDQILDAIDLYMEYFKANYSWGYSTPYFISGMYCCHVNNIAYLLKNHRTNARDMNEIIKSLDPQDRIKYDYDLLEEKYIENQNRIVDDEDSLSILRSDLQNRNILLIAPGKSTLTEIYKIKEYIKVKDPVVIEVNAVNPEYDADYLFLISSSRYDYAKSIYPEQFDKMKKILLSNIAADYGEQDLVINFNRVVKRGWVYFDNAVIDCLRLLHLLGAGNVAIAGFDEFKAYYNESYADESLPAVNPGADHVKMNDEIHDMFRDFKKTVGDSMKIEFITDSIFDK